MIPNVLIIVGYKVTLILHTRTQYKRNNIKYLAQALGYINIVRLYCVVVRKIRVTCGNIL